MGPLRGQLLENKQDVASAFIADEKTAPNEYCNLSSLTPFALLDLAFPWISITGKEMLTLCFSLLTS